MHANSFVTLLWRDLTIFLLFGALLGVLLGLILVFRPQLLERLNHVANRWVSTRYMNRWLDRSISIERWFYRNHRAAGLAIMLGATYILVYFGMLFDKAYMLQHLSGKIPDRMLDGLLDALVLCALMGGMFALLAGLLIWLRPSLLRGMEKEANQWVSLRRATKILDVPHDQVDLFVARHAQRVGWLLLLGSIYLFFILLRSLI
ncbi:MAG: hypothetical protein HY938_04580 [Nitrosomonadales bacterium]|nr:hypothetical protein [Nitrosomonadales bacterium]